MEEELKLLGLNDTDIKVYLTLLELGESLASQIAHKSRIPRASIYDILDRLIKEGLVSYIVKDFKKYFSAADPKTIVKNLDYKKERIKEILPDLEKIKSRLGKEATKVEVFEGKKGMQTLLNMILEEKELFVLGGSRRTAEVMPYYMAKWHKERARRRIHVKIIYNDTPEIRKSLKKAKKYLHAEKEFEYKFLHISYLSSIMTIVFGNKVMLGVWHKEPSGILIESAEIAKTYKQYILDLWKIAK
jgi:sugar-specific transcriptional regulator TrmB